MLQTKGFFFITETQKNSNSATIDIVHEVATTHMPKSGVPRTQRATLLYESIYA